MSDSPHTIQTHHWTYLMEIAGQCDLAASLHEPLSNTALDLRLFSSYLRTISLKQAHLRFRVVGLHQQPRKRKPKPTDVVPLRGTTANVSKERPLLARRRRKSSPLPPSPGSAPETAA